MTDATSSSTRTDVPAPPPYRQARRSGTDRMAGGVCGGLAEYSGVDAVLWRVGFVALTFLGGGGVLLYLLLWVLLPSGPAGRRGAEPARAARPAPPRRGRRQERDRAASLTAARPIPSPNADRSATLGPDDREGR